jgi:NaMN:DMB phosphoribosyltransferase
MAARSGQRPPRDHNGIMAVFRGRVRRWRQDKPGGLAVIDIPLELVADLGGRRQMRIAGSLNGVPFAGSTMLVAGGGFCVGVSAAALRTCGASVGDEVDVRLERADGGK